MPNNSFFIDEEFECPCGCGRAEMDAGFMEKLNDVRKDCDFPFLINSGFRCPDHNEMIGGKVSSSHVRGFAVDIKIEESWKRLKLVSSCLKKGITRIGIGATFVHVDTDPSLPQNVMWTYKD